MRPKHSLLRAGLPFILIAVAAFAVVAGFRYAAYQGSARQAELVAEARGIAEPGAQLLMVYVGNSNCVWCNNPALPEYLTRIRAQLESAASESGARLVTLGLSLDAVPSEGVAHLTHVGDFDQISVGAGWVNELALRMLWEGYGGPVSTPQLLVLQRNMVEERVPGVTRFYGVADEKLIARMIGLAEIEQWARHDTPFDIRVVVKSQLDVDLEGQD